DAPAGRTPSGSRSEIIRLGEMRREYALALSKLSLAERYREYEVVAGLPDPSDLIALHVHDGDFDSAISLGRAFGTGLRHAFAVLAQRAVDLSLSEAGRREVPPAPVQIEEMPGVRGSPATRVWQLLRHYLELHDSAASGYAYHKAVVERALERRRVFALPLWLVEFYKEKHPEDLIRTYLKFGLVEKCCIFTIQMIQAVLAALDARAAALANRADEAVSDGGDDDSDDDDDFDAGSDSGTVDSRRHRAAATRVATLRADLLRALEDYLDKVAAETRYAAGPDAVAAPSPPPLGADASPVGLAARLGPKAANAPSSSPSPMAIPPLFAMSSAAPASPFRKSTGR
ncbi:hypothetical protein HK405_004610, partial [Cladochytrium tenue]